MYSNVYPTLQGLKAKPLPPQHWLEPATEEGGESLQKSALHLQLLEGLQAYTMADGIKYHWEIQEDEWV